ncbi:MAG: ABC transporter ATP-binding protein [Bacteroidales bacterium]|nr:ABC transporter ATP-binding protein [Bacteroidales bacterium]
MIGLEGELEVQDLQIGYNIRNKEFRAGPISFTLAEGELAMLIGPNGVGKSTLLKTLIRLNEPIEGQVFFQGRPLRQIPKAEMSKYIAFVSTETSYPFYISVYELVSLGRIPYLNWMGRLSSEDRRIVERAIEQMQLEHLRNKPIQEVSDGERQKALIARALAQDTPVILLDEPTAFLDIVNKHNIIHLLGDIAHQQKKTVLLTTHDLNIAISETDKLLVMLPNQFLVGAPEDLQLKNQLNSLFKNQFHFDPISGTLKRVKSFLYKASLKSESTVPRSVAKLTQKALERIGYELTDNSTRINVIVKKVNQDYQWTVELADGNTFICSSLYALCRLLGEYKR